MSQSILTIRMRANPADRTRPVRRALALAWAALLIGPGTVPTQARQAPSPVFVDDSPLAHDGLIRSRELAAVGNLDEAVRVLQNLLNTEGERLLPAAGEPDLFTPVRGLVHETLLANPPLLERYRALEEPSALKQLNSAEIEQVERSRMLTTSGYEATLRLAQRRIEAAQFHAAFRTLAQLDRHPDRRGDAARDAANLLTFAASHLVAARDPGTDRLVREWRAAAGMNEWDGAAGPAPEIAPMLSAFVPASDSDLSELLPRPLWSDDIGDRLPLDSSINVRALNPPPREGALWLASIPTCVGDTVYVNNSQTLTAWNRFSLSQRWRTAIEPTQGKRYPVGPQQGFEELSSVAADSAYVVALMGLAIQNTETPKRILLCVDARTGQTRWRRLLEDYRLGEADDSRLRGPLLLDQGVVVGMVDHDLLRRRLEGASLLALDARTGEMLWHRTLGSSGSLAYGLRPAVIDAPIVHRGVLYVVNRLGFVAAVEVASGRVHWIRRWAGLPMTQSHADQPWESNTPVIHGDSLYVVAPDRSEIVRMDLATGAVRSRCPASKMDSPDYLVQCDGLLVGVSATRLVAAEMASFSPEPNVVFGSRFQTGQVRGRVVTFGKRLMVPVIDGASIYDPRAEGGDPVARLALDKPGNVLPLDGQLLVVDDQSIHTYLVWNVADGMLRDRMNAEPDDPTPAITYAELSFRAGKPENILPSIDRALNAVERDPLAPTLAQNQSRLFRAIFAMVEPPSETAGRVSLPLELRGALVQRLDRCASGPSERVASLLASGRFHESSEQPARAVESYQSVLDSPELAAATYAHGETIVSADLEATRRLRRLVEVHGHALYRPHEADADRALAELAQALEPEPFEAVARRFPVARASVTAWLEAATRYTTRGRSKLAAQALEEGLATARLSLEPGDPLVGELTGRLVGHLARTGLVYPALDALERFTRDHPNARLTENNQTIEAPTLFAELRAEIEAIDRRPDIGPNAVTSEPMLGWSVLEPVATESLRVVTDRVMMISQEDEVALFRVAGPGPLERVWGGVKDEEFLWIDPAGAFFARTIGDDEDRADYTLIRRDLESGELKWETAPFRTLVPHAPVDDIVADPKHEFIPVIDTPLAHRVPLIELNLLFDRRTAVLIDRAGRAAAIDLESGRVLWADDTPITRMHDAKLEAGTLLVGGADGPVDLEKPISDAHADDPMTGIVLALDARTGQTLHRWETTDRVRWVSLAPEGYSIIGLNDSIVSLDAYRGRERWKATARPATGSLAAWALPGRVLIRTEDNDLVQINTADGSVRENALDTRERLSSGFGSIQLRSMGANTGLTTQQGLAVFNPQGDLIGLDTSERDDPASFAAFGARHSVTITPRRRDAADGQSTVSLNIFANPSLKLLSRVEVPIGSQNEPGPCALLDGKVLISTGAITTIVDAPAN